METQKGLRLKSLGLALAGLVLVWAGAAQAYVGPSDKIRIASTGSGLCWSVPDDAAFEAGVELEQFPCTEADGQSWYLQGTRNHREPGDPGIIRSAGAPNLCVAKNSATARLMLQPCDVVGRTLEQLWLVNAPNLHVSNVISSIRLTGTNDCVSVLGGGRAWHEKLAAVQCEGTAGQNWILLPVAQ